ARCNLRCRHCLAFAPRRTAEGSAHTLAPWLLDRLREDLRYVTYSCIGDPGEPLVAPVLFQVLEALGAERPAAHAPVVHLVSNGMLLDAPMALRLAQTGVRSVAVSLDGASARTNDALRVGSRFDRVVGNLRGVVSMRRERGLDLRLGVSTVVTASNLAELEALMELAADMGLDWVKLEELVPVHGLERELVETRALETAVGRALRRAEQLKVVAVDHTRCWDLWPCRITPEAAAFHRADEFANRSEIHPCRGPWELAYVGPDGAVRMGDPYSPALGNLAEASLMQIWQGPLARSQREQAVRSRPCGQGPCSVRPRRG
ncbi:MAG: radical SAM protein, partial [Deltaproteobacteria bacterium]|nr:radical SAM protein [Deltaproteobacteria bacterium]